MLNSKRLLFILPDVAYSAELLPSKKPFSFSIQTCVQVNGTFIENNAFNVANLGKLFSKLDADEPYQVILPDDLFTNTIITIEDTGDAKVKAALKDTTLPALSLTQDTHDIVTTVLNELRGKTRVQLSAISKELLTPLRAASTNAKVALSDAAPLSWALKSIVSLEPSIVILQLGSMLYGSLHYIGVEKCFSAPSDKLDSIVETVKQLKKEESSVMTCYLVTNALVESELKEGLKQLLPIQQMTEAGKDQEKLPAMVATIIEESARTLAISDFPVPQFALSPATDTEVLAYSAVLATSAASTTQGDAMPKASSTDDTQIDKDESDLPKPKVAPVAVAAAVATPTPAVSFDEEADEKPAETVVSFDEEADAKPAETVVSFDEDEDEDKGVADKAVPLVVTAAAVAGATTASAATAAPVAAASTTAVTATPAVDSAIDLRQFAGAQSSPTDTIGITPSVTATVSSTTPTPPPIKNKSKSMTKMIITALIVFIGTVAIGVGVGILVLRYTSTPSETPPTVEVEETPAPTPEATPDTATGSAATSSGTPAGTATSSATLSPAIAAQKILVVNATDKSGYAGQIRDSLVKAGFKSVTAGNATGTYTATSDLIYQKTANAAALDAIEQGSGLTLTVDDTAKQEDPQAAYDAVIVLNQ